MVLVLTGPQVSTDGKTGFILPLLRSARLKRQRPGRRLRVRTIHPTKTRPRFSQLAVACAGALLGALAMAAQPACHPPDPCSAAEFVTRLLQVANETQPQRLPADFERAFGPDLARHTRVLVSEPVEGAQKNEVARFVRLGDETHPLHFSAADACVTFAALERGFKADGWEGGVQEVPGAQPVLRYLKGYNQLTAARVRAGVRATADCAASIVITFRSARAASGAISP
jgi:hypothetical protein